MAVQSTYSSAMAVGLPGMLYDNGPNDVISMINNEATAEMAFGTAVAFEGSTRDKGALAPDATTDIIAGILLRSMTYGEATLGDTGVKPGGVLNVLRKGRVWVTAEQAVAPGDRLFIRAVATGDEVEGALGMEADGTDMIDSTGQGVWLSTAAAGALAVLEVDFTNLKA